MILFFFLAFICGLSDNGRMQQQEFSVRPLSSDDLMSLVALEAKIQKAPWTKEHFERELVKDYSRVLLMTDDETDSIIIGYIVYWVLADDAQVLNLGVDPLFRRRGIGSTLLRKAVGEAMRGGAKKITLDVRVSNTPAIQLYQETGFSITHRRKNFYSDGEDAYFMEAELQDNVLSL